jgi:uncharacterized protein
MLESCLPNHMQINLDRIKHYPAPGRMLLFLLILASLWLPGAGLIYGFFLSTRDIRDPGVANLLSILTMGLLAIEFLFFLPWWGRKVYQQREIFRQYGLQFRRLSGLYFLKGLGGGILFTLCVFGIQLKLGWLELHQPQLPWWRLILEGSATGLGVGFAEELFFRGWMLTELERDYSQRAATIANGFIFALLHFIKPIDVIIKIFPQFPGLWLFGMMMVIAKRGHRNLLTISIGLHAGAVWSYYLIDVGKLLTPTGAVSDWITGINNNPIAGVFGIVALIISIYILSIYSPTAHPPQPSK